MRGAAIPDTVGRLSIQGNYTQTAGGTFETYLSRLRH